MEQHNLAKGLEMQDFVLANSAAMRLMITTESYTVAIDFDLLKRGPRLHNQDWNSGTKHLQEQKEEKTTRYNVVY